jgi:Putative transposase
VIPLSTSEKAFNSGRLQFFSGIESLSNRLNFSRYLAPLKSSEWVVYAKLPFAGPQQVLDYVGRYAHRVAISNNRLLAIENGAVTFRWKDYRDHNQPKTMTLAADEFLRRFLLHVLPDGFQRIRYYGFLGNRYREEKLARCRQLLGMAARQEVPGSPEEYRDRCERLTGSSLRKCPNCGHGRMVLIEALAPCGKRYPSPDTS